MADRKIQAKITFLSNVLKLTIQITSLALFSKSLGTTPLVCTLVSRNNYPSYIPVCSTNYVANEPLVKMMRIFITELSHSSSELTVLYYIYSMFSL